LTRERFCSPGTVVGELVTVGRSRSSALTCTFVLGHRWPAMAVCGQFADSLRTENLAADKSGLLADMSTYEKEIARIEALVEDVRAIRDRTCEPKNQSNPATTRFQWRCRGSRRLPMTCEERTRRNSAPVSSCWPLVIRGGSAATADPSHSSSFNWAPATCPRVHVRTTGALRVDTRPRAKGGIRSLPSWPCRFDPGYPLRP
jgi:hypothetical protein